MKIDCDNCVRFPHLCNITFNNTCTQFLFKEKYNYYCCMLWKENKIEGLCSRFKMNDIKMWLKYFNGRKH